MHADPNFKYTWTATFVCFTAPASSSEDLYFHSVLLMQQNFFEICQQQSHHEIFDWNTEMTSMIFWKQKHLLISSVSSVLNKKKPYLRCHFPVKYVYQKLSLVSLNSVSCPLLLRRLISKNNLKTLTTETVKGKSKKRSEKYTKTCNRVHPPPK